MQLLITQKKCCPKKVTNYDENGTALVFLNDADPLTLSSLYQRQNAPYDLEPSNPIPLTLYTMQCVVHVEKLLHL